MQGQQGSQQGGTAVARQGEGIREIMVLGKAEREVEGLTCEGLLDHFKTLSFTQTVMF